MTATSTRFLSKPIASISVGELSAPVAGSRLPAHCVEGRSVAVEHYTGTAYDAKGRELYTERHWSTVDGGETRRLVLFTCTDGKPFARKQVNDAGQPLAPLFALDDARFGYREGVRLDADGKREVFVRRNSGSRANEPVEDVARLVSMRVSIASLSSIGMPSSAAMNRSSNSSCQVDCAPTRLC